MKKIFFFLLFVFIVTDILAKYPSLIPLPQKIKWSKGYFSLRKCKSIYINDESLVNVSKLLINIAGWPGMNTDVKKLDKSNDYSINLYIDRIESPSFEEVYRLEVTENKIVITANTPHGVFNGIQTLLQLIQNGEMIAACEITDWPAFLWRGYMIDVGRNYMSVNLLKQQIDIMAKYKLNVFHFHATEDIAWRIAIKQYPQLTAPENMLRNKGQYYNEAGIKELIAYCKERYITFVPEIDMPGHSAAFKRAMKADMQSDTGLRYIKNILKELCETYDLPYLHIGADEVKITNKDFVPEVTAFIQNLGKKVIGWQPGGNFTDNTIRQLWMDDNGHLSAGKDIQYIDSRHLYLNHMDPLEAVTTIFYRQIGDRTKEDKNMKGATLCLWPDRSIEKEEDAIKMNAVYPGMLAFAERSWRGGGYKGWLANIGDPNSLEAKEFTQFENRLLYHKQQFFQRLSFPYVKQSGILWKLFGPYSNAGNLSKQFEPERKDFEAIKTKAAIQIVGGTIILRHWWYPLIKGAIQNPDDSTTWYATTKIWSDEDKIQPVWIGFNNLSRSPASDSPPAGAWDDKQSAVWVNGNIIAPPVWKRGGQKANSEIPLIDEGYEYREPANVLLKKGWNSILIKCPVGTFKGKDWQNPVKWMFTFAPFQ